MNLDDFKRNPVPWGPIGYIIYKRTYARLKDDGTTEEWWDTIFRCITGIREIRNALTPQEEIRLFDLIYNLKCNFSGRALWQLGTPNIHRFGGDSLQNCFSKETEILTKDGIAKIGDLVDKEIEVLTLAQDKLEWKKTKVQNFGQQKLYKVTFTNNSVVYATKNHRWLHIENKKIYNDFLNPLITLDLVGKQLPFAQRELPKFIESGFSHGFVFGDGWLSSNTPYANVAFFGGKLDVLPILEKYGNYTTWKINGIETDVVTNLNRNWKTLPYFSESFDYLYSFIMGLIAVDGSVRNGIRIGNKDESVLNRIKNIARYVGFKTGEPTLEREISPFDGSEKSLFSLTINTYNIRESDLIRQDQRDKFQRAKANYRSIGVRLVEETDRLEDVYCVNVDTYHNFTLGNGVITANCWQVAVRDPIKSFCFAFNELMLGGGVGFNITPECVYELPSVKYDPEVKRVDSPDCDYVVPDNREGWVNILGKILKCYFFTGRNLTYNTTLIRAKGKPIRSFGGVASGSEELVKGLDLICKILSKRHGLKLRPIDCLDIMNLIGQIVVSGNVRRSAQLALGDVRDTDFLNAKNWGIQTVPNWRSMSNNSVIANHYEDITPEFWDGYLGEGEPYGLVNLNACRNYGRLVDGLDYRPDSKVVGLNPCAEITLESYEACNLADIYLPNIVDKAELLEAVTLMYKVCKIISTLPFIYPETNEVVSRNHRIGISLNGFLQSKFRYDAEVFNNLYASLEVVDREFSRQLGVLPSIKLTTMKPSGTSSLLAGVTSGGHPAFAPYYIRRVRMAANDPVVDVCRKHGYPIEPEIKQDGSLNYNTMVVSFPIKTPDNTICACDVNAISQLETLLWLQKYWSDNSVSCTIYYEQDELPGIKRWLEDNYEQVKTVSFVLKSEHGFIQSPMEEITKEEFYALKEHTKEITKFTENEERELIDSVECTNGACPIK